MTVPDFVGCGTLRRDVLAVALFLVVALAVVVGGPAGSATAAAVPAQAAPPAPAAPPAQAAAPVMRVVTKLDVPFVFHDNGLWSGFSIDILNQLAVRVPFTYDIQGVNTVGQQLQAVEQGKADLSIAATSITSNREKLVDFSYPYFNSGLQVMTSTGGAGTHVSFIQQSIIRLWRPFAIVLVFVLVVAHLQWLVEARRTDDFPESYLQGVGEGLWWAAVTLTTVGYGDRTPRTIWGRALAILWMVMAIVLLANLTASITTAFTIQELRSTIQGPDQLAGKRIATAGGTAASAYLESVGLSPEETPTIADAYKLLEDHKVAAVVFDSPILLYYAENGGKGAVQVVGPLFDPQDYGIALPLGSQYRKPLNEALLNMIQDGTYARIYREWFGPS